MKTFDDSVFSGGRVRWNRLDLNPDRPLSDQTDNLYDGLIWVDYPNGCSLHVDWYPSFQSQGSFKVSIDQTSDQDEFVPFAISRCNTIAELRDLVRKYQSIAIARSSIPVRVIEKGSLPGAIVDVDELVLDQVRPLSDQVDRLKSRLFDARWLNGCRLIVEWKPPYSKTGHFAISLQRDLRGGRGKWDDFSSEQMDFRSPPSTQVDLLRSVVCGSIAELRDVVQEMARAADELDLTT